jgi:trafficking protein particle complex subunit 11
LLCTLGIASSPSHELGLEPALKDQAVLIRSELEPVRTEQAIELLGYIRERDATTLPWNERDSSRRYKFRVKTAERVGGNALP